jgi:hypothetical protein
MSSYTVGNGFTEDNLFQPSLTGALDHIDLSLGHQSGPSNSVNVQLLTDNGGTPGTLLETWGVTVTNVFGSQGSSIQEFPQNLGKLLSSIPALSAVHPILDADKAYWLLATSDSSSNNPWYLSTLVINGPQYDSGANPNVYTFELAAFDVYDGQIFSPEPSSSALILGALCVGLAARSRRNRTADHLSRTL